MIALVFPAAIAWRTSGQVRSSMYTDRCANAGVAKKSIVIRASWKREAGSGKREAGNGDRVTGIGSRVSGHGLRAAGTGTDNGQLQARTPGHLPHVPSMAQRVPSRLRPNSEPVRLPSHRNPMRQFPSRRVEHIYLIIVSPRHPQLFAIGGNVPHVGTPAAGNRPIRHNLVAVGIEHADRAGTMAPARNRVPAAVRHVQVAPISARINPVGALSRRYETNLLELLRVDDEHPVFLHVGDVEFAAVGR